MYFFKDRGVTIFSILPYRVITWSPRNILIFLSEYPVFKNVVTHDFVQPSQDAMMNIYSPISHKEEEEEENGREGWICGRGVAINRRKTNEIQCFCPPSLYGRYCQYYNDRIAVIVSLSNISVHLLQHSSNTIKILAVFLLNDTIIDHHIFHLPMVFSKDSTKKFRFNLIYQRPKSLSNLYTVRFEAYYLNVDSSIKFLAVWHYQVQFPFLPSYRLVQILRFEQQSSLMSTTHLCRRANPCLQGSQCHPVMNKINDTSAYYCHCHSQTFGEHCQHRHPLITSRMCSKYALERTLSPLKAICLCPIHLYGPTCHLKHTCIDKKPCGDNRGKCYINPDNPSRDYICVCDKKFFGKNCQLDSAMVEINFTDFSFLQTPSNYILSTVIQLCDLQNQTLDLLIREKRVYEGLPPTITQIYHNDHRLPILGIMKLYHKHDLTDDYVANLEQPDYFILYIISSNDSHMNLISTINVTNYCPYTPVAFQKNVSNASHLSECKLTLIRINFLFPYICI